jgi:hypothetical protein
MKILRIAVAAALAAATAVAGLATFAAPASADVPASNTIQYVTQFFWGDVTTVATTGTVSCPSGTRVVSSGASVAGGTRNGAGLVGIAPDINSFTSVTVTGRTAGYMQVTVGCEPTAALSEVTTRTIQLPYGSGFRRGVVYCPPGMRAFGGGGYMVRPFGILATGSYDMTSNTVSADGTGWTYAATAVDANTAPVITTQCAPLRGSYVSTTGTPATHYTSANVYGTCLPGYTALSGGVYLSKPDGNEVQSGEIDYSVPASGNRWYVDGLAFEDYYRSDKLVALEQCIR